MFLNFLEFPRPIDEQNDFSFTKNPSKLKGKRHLVTVEKGSRGFGFTIVGGDDPEEFLQIKGIVSGGPASRSNNVQPGKWIFLIVLRSALAQPSRSVNQTLSCH